MRMKKQPAVLLMLLCRFWRRGAGLESDSMELLRTRRLFGGPRTSTNTHFMMYDVRYHIAEFLPGFLPGQRRDWRGIFSIVLDS